MGNRKVPTINEANLLYLILGILLLTVGSVVQQINLNVGLLVTEYILILIPVILFLRLKGYSVKKVLRIKPINIKEVIFIFFIIVFSYPIAVFFNFIIITIIDLFSDLTNVGVPIPTTINEFLISLFVIGITPGICEEVFFRGLMLNSYEKLGKNKAIIITSLLFGLFHFNIFNLVGPVFLGIILGIIYFKTNSIFGAMLGHAINNSIALTLGFLATTRFNEIEDIVTNTPNISQTQEIFYAFMTLFILSLISTAILVQLFKNFPKKENIVDEDELLELNIDGDMDTIEKINWAPITIVILIFIFINSMLFIIF
ncbi:MAG: CPBP family intramembrane metalloprotease [Tissierellales bacterium]|nr:CPBP family intramembrane metalloprotease [Tissierellales bacterium]